MALFEQIPRRAKCRSAAFWHLLVISLAPVLWLTAHDRANAQIVAPAAPCNSIAGTVVTCSGDVHQGVLAISPTFQTLNVTTTTDITPASGVAAVRLVDSTGGKNLSINVNTTGAPNGIVTVGGAAGIFLQTIGQIANFGDGTISSIGNIAAKGTSAIGINATKLAYDRNAVSNVAATTGTLSITSQGNIRTRLNGTGINAFNESLAQSDALSASASANASAVIVTSTGNISAGKALGNDGGIGISASNISSALAAGNGNAIANAGAVTVTNTGNISVGGTGIIAGISSGAAAKNGTATVMSGDITILTTGNITTGPDGQGIFADNQTGIGPSGTGSVQAGNVNITNTGNISTGKGGFGIRALNVSTGTLGNIAITSSGNISGGANGVGIDTAVSTFAGPAKSGGTTIDIIAGTVSAGTRGTAVHMFGGMTNSVTNFGTIATVDGINGDAVVAILGKTASVSNFGTITGNIDLGDEFNSFNNQADGLLNSGRRIYLNGGTLTNSGTISPGGSSNIFTSAINGDLIQTASGKLAIDVDLVGHSADKVLVTGNASLAGTVVVTLNTLKKGPQSFTILSAGNGAANNGLNLVSSPALRASLVYPANGTDVVLSTDLNFVPPTPGPIVSQPGIAPSATGLNTNQLSIAQGLQSSFLAGSGGVSPVLLGLLHTFGDTAYQNALDQLSPEIYSQGLIETLYGSQQFSNDMMSCRIAGEDGAAFIREGQCVWARARARFLDVDHTNSNIGAKDTTGSFSGGAQFALAPDWRLGVAAGYDRISLSTGAAASSSADRANAGAVIKYNSGPILLAAGVTAGWGSYDTTRTMSFGGFNAQTTSSNDIDYVSGQLHAAYLLDQGSWYFKPLVDASVTEFDLHGFTEHGGGGAALKVPSRSDTVVSVSPALEIGTELRFDSLAVLRPFIRAGVTWQDTDSFALSASFADAPQGVSPFSISTKFDRVLADLSAGVDVINTAGAVMRLQYDGRFGQETQQNSISLKGSVPF